MPEIEIKPILPIDDSKKLWNIDEKQELEVNEQQKKDKKKIMLPKLAITLHIQTIDLKLFDGLDFDFKKDVNFGQVNNSVV